MNSVKAFTYPFMWEEHVRAFRRAVPRDVIVRWVKDDINQWGKPRMVYEVPAEYYSAWCATRYEVVRKNLLERSMA